MTEIGCDEFILCKMKNDIITVSQVLKSNILNKIKGINHEMYCVFIVFLFQIFYSPYILQSGHCNCKDLR